MDSLAGGTKKGVKRAAEDNLAQDNDGGDLADGSGGDDGQDPEQQLAKLQARREANRMHALKSRQRSKLLLSELQQTVQQLTAEKVELERQNAVFRAQVDVLQQQNRALLQSQQQLLLFPGGAGAAGNNPSGAQQGVQQSQPQGMNPMAAMMGLAQMGLPVGVPGGFPPGLLQSLGLPGSGGGGAAPIGPGPAGAQGNAPGGNVIAPGSAPPPPGG